MNQFRSSVMELQDTMLEMDQVEIPVRHYFANGFYAREMTMLANVTLIGHIHKSEHLCIISKGRVTIRSEEINGTFEAPYTYVSKPGAKRAIYSHEKTVWTTVHMTENTDLSELEKELISESYKTLESEQTLRLKA